MLNFRFTITETMSVETVPQDDGEIQDLVLMFANSRIPRGSDAFQTLIDDFLKNHDDSQDESETGSEKNSDTTDSVKSDSVSDGQVTPAPTKSVLKTPSAKERTVRMVSPKPLAHVHWPDEKNANIASCPSSEKKHHARIYVKTTPKPILKHEDDIENT